MAADCGKITAQAGACLLALTLVWANLPQSHAGNEGEEITPESLEECKAHPPCRLFKTSDGTYRIDRTEPVQEKIPPQCRKLHLGTRYTPEVNAGIALCKRAFAGAAPEELINPHLNNPMTFDTRGRAKKIIETPSGPVAVYDPAQDERVLEAIREVYNSNTITFGEVSGLFGVTLASVQPTTSAETLRLAQTTQSFDLLRLGCRNIRTVPCQGFGSSYFTKTCDDASDLGTHVLSECEEENLKAVDHWDLNEAMFFRGGFAFIDTEKSHFFGVKIVVDVGRQCSLADDDYHVQAWTVIGPDSGYSLEKTTRLLTTKECLLWDES